MHRIAMLIVFILGGMCSAITKAAPTIDTRVGWSSKCPNDPEKPGAAGLLAAVVLPLLVDKLVDHAATSLKTASGPETQKFTALNLDKPLYDVSKDGDLQGNPNVMCVIVIRGEFEQGGDSAEVDAGLKETYFRFEAAIEPVKRTKYFRLAPHYLSVKKLDPGNIWSRKGDYQLSISLLGLGKEQPFASTTFSFEGVEEGTVMALGDSRLLALKSEPWQYPGDMADANVVQARIAKDAAPYLLAKAILLAKAESLAPVADLPNSMKDKEVEDTLKVYCDERMIFNATLPATRREYEARCEPVTLKSAREKLDKSTDMAFYNKESRTWARNILCKPANNEGVNKKCIEELIRAEKINPQNYPSAAEFNVAFDDQITNALNYAKKEDSDKPNLSNPTGLFKTSIVLAETRHGNKFGQALADALGASSEDIKKELKAQLPDAKEKAKAEQDIQDRKERRAIQIADLEVKEAEQKYLEISATESSNSDKLAAQLELVKTKHAANDAYRNAGLSVPYPEYD